MAVRHLTHEQIQEYLDNGNRAQSTLPTHLESCSVCQARLQQYRSLYAALEKELPVDLSANFADLVVSKIQAKASEGIGFSVLQIWVAVLGVVVGMAVTIYFTGFGLLSKVFSDEWREAFSELFVSMNHLFGGRNFDFSLIGLGVLTLLLISVIDRFLFQSKVRPSWFG